MILKLILPLVCLACTGFSNQVTMTGVDSVRLQTLANKMKMPTSKVKVGVENLNGECSRTCLLVSTTSGMRTYTILKDKDGINKFVLYHELGHVFDKVNLIDSDRSWFKNIINDNRVWFQEPNAASEKFAESYRICATIGVRAKAKVFENFILMSGYDLGSVMTAKKLRRVCTRIINAGH